MKRFQCLVKKKIKRELSDGEARELHGLLQHEKNYRLMMRLLFDKPAEDNSGAEKAFAAHRKRIGPAIVAGSQLPVVGCRTDPQASEA